MRDTLYDELQFVLMHFGPRIPAGIQCDAYALTQWSSDGEAARVFHSIAEALDGKAGPFAVQRLYEVAEIAREGSERQKKRGRPCVTS